MSAAAVTVAPRAGRAAIPLFAAWNLSVVSRPILGTRNGKADWPHLGTENRGLNDHKGSAYSEAFYLWPSWP